MKLKPILALGLLIGTVPVAPSSVSAQSGYTLQRIAQLGDRAGDVPLQAEAGYFSVGTLNNSGQIIFSSVDTEFSEVLIQYSSGQLIPIVAPSKPAVGATRWPDQIRLMPYVSMNNHGNAVFSAAPDGDSPPQFTAHLWNAQVDYIIPLTAPNAPAGADRVFEGASQVPVINDLDEVVLTARVKEVSGGRTGDGIFHRDPSGELTPIALPGQPLPDGRIIAQVSSPDINDAGLIAFLARAEGDPEQVWSAYQWEKGSLTPLALVGASTRQGERITSVWSVWLNDANRTALVEASVDAANRGVGLYRVAGGQITSLARRGDELPGGGQLRVQNGPSHANDRGEHAFLATLEDGSTAAYVISGNGELSLVLKSGETTNLGRVTNVGQGASGGSLGIGLNDEGKLALTVSIEGGPDTLVLLSPSDP